MASITSFYRWWACDFGPVDGRLRFAVYGLLLLVGYQGLLNNTLGRVAFCPEEMFQPPGVMSVVTFAGFTQWHLYKILLLIKAPLVVVWMCSAVGFGGRLPLFLTGLGVSLYWGCYQSVAGSNHTWHAPMFLLLVCGIFLRPDRWSLDALVAARWPAWPFAPAKYRGPDLSGYARKLVLLLVMFTLFAGGVAKLWHGGIAWLDGASLYFYLQNHNNPKTWFGPRLLQFLMQHPSVVVLLSWWTIALELGALLTLFYARLRWPFAINAWAFHLGIWFLMLPRYWPQMICYLLLVPWEGLRLSKPKELLQTLSGWRKPSVVPHQTLPSALTQATLSVLASVITFVLLGTMLLQREWFPLTHVPMYSSYVSSQRLGAFRKADYGDLEALARIAAVADNDSQPWWIKYEIERKMFLDGASGRGAMQEGLLGFPQGVVERFLWARRISYSLLDDLRKGATVSGAQFQNTQAMLDAVADRILDRPEWVDFDEFSLVFVENEGSRRRLGTINRAE